MSNLTQRILTAAVAIPLILWICITGGAFFLLFVTLASSIALVEFYALARTKGAKPLVAPGVLAGICINLSFYHLGLAAFIADTFGVAGMPFPSQAQLILMTLLVAMAVFSLIELFRNNGSALLNMSVTVLGMMYISLFFGSFIGLRELFTHLDPPVYSAFSILKSGGMSAGEIYRYGGYTVISIFAMIWICDTAAYHAGSVMGKHKLFPRVSPKKSWEGAIAGFIFAVLTAVAARALVLDYLSLPHALIIGGTVGIFGQLGDLVESLYKRDAGVKDSSNLIPGHGGMFDRFDSLLLVSPLVYLYIDFVVF